MPQLTQTQDLRVRQQLELAMTPQQMLGLRILQMPSAALEQYLGEQLALNPVLEVAPAPREVLESDFAAEDSRGDQAAAEEDRRAELIDYDETLVRAAGEAAADVPYEDYLPSVSHRSSDLDAEERRKYFFDSIRAESSLLDQLDGQIADLAGGDEELARLCREILGDVDDNGYLRATDDDLNARTHAGLHRIARAVKLLQSLEPAGFAARDFRECLLLQLERRGRRGGLAWRIVAESLEDLGRNRVPLLARRYGVSLEEVQAAAREIRGLSPRPGGALSSGAAPVVAPEVFIERGGGGVWTVRLNRDLIPVVALSPEYTAMLDDPGAADETKAFLRSRIADGQQLIWAVDQRLSTLERIALVLVRKQQDFLAGGPLRLHPLTLAQVAEPLDLHEATISRAISGKFLGCPWGTFPFKYFFTAGYQAAGGETVSSRAIQQRIAQLVGAEDQGKPLSDQKLADLLRREGVEVARRTVAKYREALDIPAASLRRKHR